MRFANVRRWRRAAVVVILGAVVAIVGASLRLFVWPATDPPGRVDAIVALATSIPRRDKALALARAGYSRVVVVSTTVPHEVPCPQPEPGIDILCFRPDPLTTQGEARYVGHLAAERNWRRIMIVPTTTQATRARLLFERCYTGQLLVVPARDLKSVLYGVAYEWGALAKAIFLRQGC
jgi:hypothetical protein